MLESCCVWFLRVHVGSGSPVAPYCGDMCIPDADCQLTMHGSVLEFAFSSTLNHVVTAGLHGWG